jgi:subtilisin family serine protease
MKAFVVVLSFVLAFFGIAEDASAAKKKKIYRVRTSWSEYYGAKWAQDRLNQPFGRLDGLTPINQDAGSGATVYVIDTASEDEDCNGHGTFVSSLINDNEFGVAPSANVVNVKALGCDGSGTVAQVVAAINWVKENADYENSIVNMSLGGPKSATIDNATNELADLMPVVVAAGNDGGHACNMSPARAVNAITVASFNFSGLRSLFSNWGSCVDIWAPGSNVDGRWGDGDHRQASGTSAAAPLVAASIAYIASRDGVGTMQAAQILFNESSNLPIIDGRCIKRCNVLWLRETPDWWLRSDSPSWRP